MKADRQTLGEYRVGIKFNPSNNGTVSRIKQAAANFIDEIRGIDDSTETPAALGPLPEKTAANWQAEVRDLKDEAMRMAEGAAMWAVKAATKPLRPE